MSVKREIEQPKPPVNCCGFGLFVGDYVRCAISTYRWEGVVQWIDRKKRTISIANLDSKGYWVGEIDAVKIVRMGNRRSSLLFPKSIQREIFDSLSSPAEKLYFLYHLYGTGRSAFAKAAAFLKMTRDAAKATLLKYKEKGLL